MSSVGEDVLEMHDGDRRGPWLQGRNGGSDLSKTECINQLATAGMCEGGDIDPLESSRLWERGNHLL